MPSSEPFFRTRADGAGTGKRLVTVYELAQQSGGCILAVEGSGQGNDIEICLPRAIPAAAEQNIHPAPRGGIVAVKRSWPSRTMLLCGSCFREFMKCGGDTVLEALNGKEALHVLDSGSSAGEEHEGARHTVEGG